jgi:membrane protease YdiL (CAAX protease family)
MSVSFFGSLVRSAADPDAPQRSLRGKVARTVLLLVWMAVGFGFALLLTEGVLEAIQAMGVPLAALDKTVYAATVMAGLYAVAALVIIGLPWVVKKYRTTKAELGLTRLMSWGDIGLAILGFVVYLGASWLLLLLVSRVFSSIDLQQVQETGFTNLRLYYQYLVAFLTLVVIAPMAEELLFRGYLYGKLRRLMPLWVAILITSVTFGLVHGQWNVGIDVFALSVVLCGLREMTGSIWAGILLHMIKNAIAYYVLFIYPLT